MSDYHVVKIKTATGKPGRITLNGQAFMEKHMLKLNRPKDLPPTRHGEVRIHGLDGRIRDSDTIPPARDPFPPRDKRH